MAFHRDPVIIGLATAGAWSDIAGR